MGRWTDTLLTTAPQPVQSVIETPVTVAPTAPVAPPVTRQEPPEPQVPDFETEVAFSIAGANKAERWYVSETLKERGQTPTPELVWFMVQKARNREKL